jgi:hypothetical protein
MDCRTFRRLHLAFVDDTLPGADRAAMELHRGLCEDCARRDSLVRQSLLLARNVTPIEPSPDFMDRLQQRLQEVEPDRRTVYVRRRPELYPGHQRLGGAGAFGSAALAVAACALLAVGVMQMNDDAAPFGPAANPAPAVAVDVPDAMPVAPASGSQAERTAEPAAASRRSPSLAQGYTLDMDISPVNDHVSAMMLMTAGDTDFDPAIMTSASVGLTVWPALMIPDDLPRAFREAGFSVAGMSR